MVTAMHATTGGNSAELASVIRPLAYNLQEVADLLGLSYRKVRYMADSGELPIVQFGRARRVLASSLDEYLAEKKREQAS
jgi:DNA binding domain, excisionase family